MKSILTKILLIGIVIISIISILNLNVTIRQGINYKVHTIQIPLYLKLLDFFDRHYNYKQLVSMITRDAKTKEESVMLLFEWTNKNIKKVPDGLPIVDDHVWHIIIRGYGTNDQVSDVFTTLCNYTGVDAFYSWVYTEKHDSRIPLSLVKIKKRWTIFDPYSGVYFKNNKGELADIAEIVKGKWLIESIASSGNSNIDYGKYLSNLPVIRTISLSRSNTQSPINRLKYQIKKWLRQI